MMRPVKIMNRAAVALSVFLALTAMAQSRNDGNALKPDAVRTPSTTETCTLGIAQAPELNGFRLGMAVQQIKQRFPGATIDTTSAKPKAKMVLVSVPPGDKLLEGKRIQPGLDGTYLDASQFPGFDEVKGITLYFMNDRVTAIEVGYANPGQWKNIDQFSKAVATKLNLPDAWGEVSIRLVRNINVRSRTMKCSGFQLSASLSKMAEDFLLTVGAGVVLELGSAS